MEDITLQSVYLLLYFFTNMWPVFVNRSTKNWLVPNITTSTKGSDISHAASLVKTFVFPSGE